MPAEKNKGGRPPGRKNDATLAKDAAREALRVLLMKHQGTVADALVSRCTGVRYFVTRNKSGKYEIVTDPQAVVDALNKENELQGEFYTDKPETAAIKEFFDRTVDQASKPAENVNVDAKLEISWKGTE